MRGTVLVALALAVSSAAGAQQLPAQAYVFAAPGVTGPGGVGFMHAGFGGEGLVYRGLGVGADLGYAFPFQSAGAGIGLLSANASYHFQRQSRVVPFVTGGPAIGFRGDVGGFANIGGGLTYWFREHLGFRFEVRDSFRPDGSLLHLVQFRAALSFR